MGTAMLFAFVIVIIVGIYFLTDKLLTHPENAVPDKQQENGQVDQEEPEMEERPE